MQGYTELQHIYKHCGKLFSAMSHFNPMVCFAKLFWFSANIFLHHVFHKLIVAWIHFASNKYIDYKIIHGQSHPSIYQNWVVRLVCLSVCLTDLTCVFLYLCVCLCVYLCVLRRIVKFKFGAELASDASTRPSSVNDILITSVWYHALWD